MLKSAICSYLDSFYLGFATQCDFFKKYLNFLPLTTSPSPKNTQTHTHTSNGQRCSFTMLCFVPSPYLFRVKFTSFHYPILSLSHVQSHSFHGFGSNTGRSKWKTAAVRFSSLTLRRWIYLPYTKVILCTSDKPALLSRGATPCICC